MGLILREHSENLYDYFQIFSIFLKVWPSLLNINPDYYYFCYLSSLLMENIYEAILKPSLQ